MIPGLLFCPMFKLIDHTGTPWTERDQKVLVYMTKEGCRKGDPLQPCVYTFEKRAPGDYNVMCGPEDRKKKETFTDEK